MVETAAVAVNRCPLGCARGQERLRRLEVHVERAEGQIRRLVGGSAAVRDVVEGAGRFAEPGGVRRHQPAGLGSCLVRGAAGAWVEHGPVLQGAHEGAHPFLDCFGPALGLGVRGGRGAVVCRATGGAAEERLRGAGGASRCAQPPPQCGGQAHDGEDDHDQAEWAAGGGPGGAGEEIADPVPEAVEAAFEKVRIMFVVHRVGEFVPCRFTCGYA